MSNKLRLVYCIFLSICMVFLSARKSPIIKIDKSIPSNVVSAKQIEEITETYAEKYLGKNYQMGEISMDVNMDGKGKIELTYTDVQSKDIPNMIIVVVDTQKEKIVQVEKLPKDNKLNPGEINFDEWKIDSSDALNICREFLKKDADNEFDNAFITTINFYNENQEMWDIVLFNKENSSAFKCIIDPYTGEIVNYELVK